MDFHYQPPKKPWLEFLYQDDDILIANKPSGLLTVPGKAEEHYDSLISRTLQTLPTARIVHRLDMSTSGLLIIALHKKAQAALHRQFQERTVEKTYEAIVWKPLHHDQGTVRLPLRCDWPNRPKQMVDMLEGKDALTHYRVLSHTENTSRVELYPVTGRSHQLRVHMLAIGHPILGDRFYGQPIATSMASRLLLHARYLRFTHPGTQQLIEFTCPCPF